MINCIRGELLCGTRLSTSTSRLVLAALLGTGAMTAARPAGAANFNVANDAQLRAAITSAQNGDTITFTQNITLGSNLPQVQRNVTIEGGNFTLSGNNQFRAVSVQSGTVAINNLTIANAKAQGGTGGQGGDFGGGGGGGAGLGGAVFVASGAGVTLTNVALQGNLARGGNGGADDGTTFGNGGGGGGGYLGDGAPYTSGGQGGAGNGGKGGTGDNAAQPGGFGGGAGGNNTQPRDGGFGGGGGGVYFNADPGGGGGFGGGQGAGTPRNGASKRDGNGAGGGGAGLGGAIFVQQGGNLTINGSLGINQNKVEGGEAGGKGKGSSKNGQGIGSGIFLHGNGSFTVAPGAGQTQTIADAIVDQTGVAKSGGSWSMVKNGAGTTILTGANAYTGGTTVNAGILQGNTSGLQGNIVNNASVVFDQTTGAGKYTGNMSGTGGLTKSGAGSVALSGTNTYGGGTTVTGGTLLFNSDTNLGAAGVGIILNQGTIGTGATVQSNRAITLQTSGGIQSDGTLTLSGVISGNGQLVKSGGGTLILTGTNTYGGGTTVTGGVLRYNVDANLGAAGSITLNGGSVGSTTDTPAATTYTRDLVLTGNGGVDVAKHPITWGGNISGAGQFIKSGDGELSFAGTNTYSGGTLVRRGGLRITSDAQLGAVGKAVALENNGTLRASDTFATARAIDLTGAGGVILVDDGKTFTLQGTVSGTNITKVANGTLVLAGNSTYTGTTSVFGGTLRGNATTIRGNVAFNDSAEAKTLVFDQATDATFAGNIGGVGISTGTGNVVKAGAGKLVLSGTSKYTGTTTVSAGSLQGTSNSLIGAIANNAAVIFDQSFAGAYAGNMTGTGTLTKNGTGKLTLTGANSVGGGTTINAGGFYINGTLASNVTLNQNGTLGGAGHINGNFTNNGGKVDPGNSIGNLTINGNLTWNSGTFDVEVNPNGTSDRITVVGAGHKITVHAGTLNVVPEPGSYTPNTRYTILTAPAGGIATFNDVAGGVGFLTPSLSFDDSNLYLSLVLAPNAFRSAGQTVNQQAVGGALDAVAASGNVGGVVTTIANLSPSQGPTAFQALSPEPYADFGTVNTRAAQLFMNAVGRQMAGERGGAVGAPKGVALAEACDVACDETAPPRLSAWLSGIGSLGSVLGDNNASGLTYTLGGTAFGIDYRLDPRFLLGIAGGWVGGSQWVNGFGGNGYTDALSVALYGSFTQNPGGGFYADALIGYANASNRLQRVVSIPGQAAAVANGQTNANQFLGQVETGYRFGLLFPANTSISPFGRLQVSSVNQAGFTESGTSPFNLSVAQQTTTSVRTTFGADLGASFDMGGGRPLDIGLRLGWMHEFAETARPISAAFAAAPVSQFTVFGATPQRDSAVVGFSATAAVTDRASVFVSYDGEVGGGTDNHALRIGFRMSW